MSSAALFSLLLLISPLAQAIPMSPLWKVFCQGVPVYRGRIDSIVNPGALSSHVHKVAGGNHFSAAVLNQSPEEMFNVTYSASCTTCSIHTVDNSNYWHPELYYQWPNGTFSLVPNGGLTVYYLSRAGDTGTQRTNPNWQPIPKGLRMVAGDPMRRTFDENDVTHTAISFVCLAAGGAPETNQFQTDKYFCKNGFRAQVFFPMCWDGVNLDSPDHKSHMSYPTKRANGGDCPATHPVRIPGIFFEAFYSVDQFPHGTGTNPFVFSNGDPTGYGYHGDFVSGWDPEVMRKALLDDSCDASSTNNGNTVTNCLPLKPFVKASNNDICELAVPIPLTEGYGLVTPIKKLPGCNPITQTNAKACTDGFNPKDSDNSGTFHIKSALTGKYLTFDSATQNVYANGTTTAPNYRQVWGQGWSSAGRSLRSSEANKHWSMRDTLQVISGSPDTWETFTIEPQTGANSSYVTFRSFRNSKLVAVQADGTLKATTNDLGTATFFQLIVPNGGFINQGITNADLPQLVGGTYTPINNPDPEYEYKPDTENYDYTFGGSDSASANSTKTIGAASGSSLLVASFCIIISVISLLL
eukprot:TRINITY_DN12618_c0_g1_i1.p1 TRINITY_DN12618_c0_g1~~TRINITY_DN12618_c0_g1_i1.p1  ORF type:complete len:582 (-),score=180.01 TRINITY_DN12618_c0_g1_i1:250-1995(-)